MKKLLSVLLVVVLVVSLSLSVGASSTQDANGGVAVSNGSVLNPNVRELFSITLAPNTGDYGVYLSTPYYAFNVSLSLFQCGSNAIVELHNGNGMIFQERFHYSGSIYDPSGYANAGTVRVFFFNESDETVTITGTITLSAY